MYKKLTTYYFPNNNTPKNIVSNHVEQFISKQWQTALYKLNLNVSHTSIFHPLSNSAEKVMKELGRMFRYYWQKSTPISPNVSLTSNVS